MPIGEIMLAVAFIMVFGAAAIALGWGRRSAHRYRDRVSRHD